MSVRPEKTYSPSVEGDPCPPLHRERAPVRRQLAGEDAEQRRLAGAVAAGEGHPLARLELEGDVLEEQLAADVDVERGCGRDRHSAPERSRRSLEAALPTFVSLCGT